MFLCVFSWSYYGIENLEWQKSTPQYPSPPDTITLFQNEPQTKWSNLLAARWPEPSGRPLIGGDQSGLDQ